MDFLTLLLIAVGLSMDAFAVAICKGLSLRRITLGRSAVVGVWFGGFQALMPIVGYFVGAAFSDAIKSVDHWVAFALLALIGVNMIKESFEKENVEECESCNGSPLSPRNMLPMAVATSIDALAVGVSFAFLGVNIWSAAACIGITTLVLSMAGVKIGGTFGSHYKSKAELAGGIILILIGLKILLEHTVLA